MAGFLTPAQFAKTAAAKKPGATYQSYKSYVTNTRSKRETGRATAAANAAASFAGIPAAVPQAQLTQQAQAYYPNDPSLAPYSQQQLTQQAQGMVSPIFANAIKTITDQIGKTTQLGTNAIQGYGREYQSQLPAIQANIGNIYSQAKNETGAVNDALANFIRDQGSRSTTDLAAADAAAGGTGAGVSQVAGYGAGASGAQAAYGGSSLERIIGEGAAQQAFAQQLPAFGSAQTGQNLGNFLGQQQAQLSDARSTLQGQLPQTLQDTYQNLLNRELQKQGLRQQRQGNVADFVNAGLTRNSENTALRAQLFNQQQTLAQDQSQYDSTLSYNQQQAAAKNGGVDPQQAALREATPNLIAFVNQLHNPTYDKNGINQISKGLSYGKIRSRLTATIKAQFGAMNPKALKTYVDQILMGAGWVPPSAGGSTAPQMVPDFGVSSIMNGTYGGFPLVGQPSSGFAYPPGQNPVAPGLWGGAALGQ